MNLRPLFVALLVGVASVGACVLNTAGLPATSTDAGMGGSPSVTSGAFTSGSGVVTDAASSTGHGGSGGGTTAAQTGSGSSSDSSASSSSSSASSSSSSSSASSSSSSSSSASSSSSTGGGGTTCDAQYGAAPGYQGCVATPMSCEFNVDLQQSKSCGEVCGALGGECLKTIDNNGPCQYLAAVQDCAFKGYTNAVCVCSLGCGAGAPCAPNKACSGGLCAP